ncbi:restriction endonuclease subunit S [Stutzerimonas stutzeri]|jgi:type I restriction enzyme, S subunit|uniref:Restriction endonuclease subunit S n=3 Tax=Stutzerimonas stutzeri TaxID=316 RepID=A0AA42KYR9_STUST|nr:restriction endonuclease subunit S [Stutzerimonas stutzeri]EPL62181.1 restriction modification system DNA specificity domain-containing protein [Stutzerimonas stutzeri B1SMN1]NMY64826.1 restriction endonuclease subunit S [Pseudomonas sp. WS 5018]HAW40976.1 type I restriction endonuclease subunit S [Pseudomonas sp.]AEA83395.1 restriction modification system DNA specificity domain protein [Stutzerimonas stutzeri DSM 4166]MBH3353519.1 restriction endonuclease subunit S [Stutzerimonas stutzeri]
MTALLTDNLPLLAGAPNGIKKLRELILELAVRGKLVPQDPSDEPASELLRRIAEEKARLVAEGKIKKQKPLTERDDEAPEIELPAGWAWARLSNVVNVLNGRAYKKEELLDAGTPVLRVGNLFTSNHWYHSNLTLEEDKYCNPGDLLFAWSASFGPFIWQGERSIYHYHIWKLDFYAQGQLSKHYLYNFLLEQTQEIKAAGHGVSMVHMTKEKMEKLVVPVPPLAEQHRIVAKVDELMALCDRLEAQQADAENAHAQLVQALLGSLTQAADAGDFAASWQRLAEHFHTLFTTESSIDALKQSLLQLAVMGKLVPQDPTDEPASELMVRLRQERSEWLLSKQDSAPECKTMLRKLSSLSEASPPFPLPDSWQAVHLIDCSRMLVDCHNKTAPYASEGIPIIRTSNIRNREFRFDDLKYVNDETYEYWSRRCPPEPGDIMFTREAPMGEAAIIPDGAKFCLGQRTMLVRPMHDYIDNRYLLITLTEPHLLERASTDAIGSTVKHLRVGDVEQLNIPLPPLAEQHRIVAKVDQLMVLCDQLRTRLTQARQLNEQLASALVEQAVA